MLFNSPTFIIFFVCVFSLYWALRARTPQNVLLLAASYVFYGAWSWKFLALLFASTLFDFACGMLIAAATEQRRKRLFLVASVVANLALLATFKYLGFFVHEAAALLEWLGFHPSIPVLSIVLPVGISFYTFQSLGYVVDVYRGKVPPERRLLEYALYVAFFPQLVAGPIERAGHLLPQFHRDRAWSSAAFESGLQLMIWGLFKKIVIADNLAPYVNAVYAAPAEYSGVAIVTATVFFAFQIYCDFSGYTDTARGVARTLGFELMRNFNHPYVSRNPVEFWRRWHISLSQWFQDYLYYPLAMRYMRKGGWASKYKAHIIAMGLIGFWHGANWTFVTFGLYWGFVIAIYLYLTERLAASAPPEWTSRIAHRFTPLRDALSVGVMFVIVSIGWVFFRAPSMSEAWYMLSHVFSTAGAAVVRRTDVPGAAILWALIAGLVLAEWAFRRWSPIVSGMVARFPGVAWRYALASGILFSYLITQNGTAEPFIYFQF